MGRQHDLLIITDATGSMSTYLAALRQSIPEIFALSRLAGIFERVGMIAYRDYDCDNQPVLEWSGWDKSVDEMLDFATSLQTDGNGDTDEAAKTALIRALEVVDPNKDTVVLFYTDAPPHHPIFRGPNNKTELAAFPAGATDWVKLANSAYDKHMRIFSFISAHRNETLSFYGYLSQATGGLCMTVREETQRISRLTIDTLLTWMGAVEPSATPFAHTGEAITYAVSPLDAPKKPTDEDAGNEGYLPKSNGKRDPDLKRVPLDIGRDLPRTTELDSKVVSLPKRFADQTEVAYRALVYSTLNRIIRHNVASLTYNAVFGQLWRAVCREQTEEKEEIVQAFGKAVGDIKNADQRKSMTDWLEQSYDSSVEVEEIVKSATEGCQWMYLDLDAQVDMTRVELLEASRSFHRGVLKKLASIFTHVKILEPDVVLTEHQRAIPLGLPPRKIFRLLPHLVVSGTLYSSRASALMAILALTVGVPFLQQPATTVAGFTKGTWLDAEHPETLAWDCASLLLGAPDPDVFLQPNEREVYTAMRRYKLLELNMDAELAARVPWTPEKASGVGDVRVECKRCKAFRSTTIMSSVYEGVCGYCADALNDKIPRESLSDLEKLPVNKPEDACWVECGVRTCRAQYVVENPKSLNVRPKCWYCRQSQACPYLECTKCTNRIVTPKAYAPADPTTFVCPACTTGTHVVFEDTNVTTRALVKENSAAWLGITDTKFADSAFRGYSAFKLYTAHGGAEFFLSVTASAPGATTTPTLLLRDKPIQNVSAMLGTLNERIGRGDIARATCALCFDDFAPDKVGPACGRSGCGQRACKGCLNEWYGGNKVGTLLNTRQLACPFCSRVPVAKIVLRTNPEVGGLKGIKEALEDRAWFHAWCGHCSTAKPAVERRCTDGGRLPNIADFVCEDCQTQRAQAAEQAAAERRRLEQLLEQYENDGDDERRVDARRRLAELESVQVDGEAQYVVRACPNEACGVMIAKEFGCDHIECGACGTHWCWVCAKICNEDTEDIYDHLNEEHGGYYAADED